MAQACLEKLTAIQALISTREEIVDFGKGAKRKVRELMMVAKKGVALKKVTEYRIVKD